MIEKDYIMREVQKLVQVLIVILGLKQEKKFDKALVEIDNMYARFFDENRKLLQEKDIEGLIQLCTKGGTFSADLAFALGDIMKEEAEIMEMQGETGKAMEKYKVVLELYELAVAGKDVAIPIDAAAKMQELQRKVNAIK